MEMTLGQVAAQVGRTPRAVRQAVSDGRLPVLREVGRQVVVDDVAVLAWRRSTSRGSVWRARTRDAALDLLSVGATSALDGSQRSRLVASLRSMSARSIAHAAGGVDGGWGRYRAEPGGIPIGPSAAEVRELGIVEGSGWLHFVEVSDLDAWELQHAAVLDGDGPVCVVERETSDRRVARHLLDCYLLGDARVSTAAGSLLEERARAL